MARAVPAAFSNFAGSRVKLRNIGSLTETKLSRIIFLRVYRCRLILEGPTVVVVSMRWKF
jgi:hypothetical protein